jgi:hypothetical protein
MSDESISRLIERVDRIVGRGSQKQ